MEVSQENIQAIVARVLAEMNGTKPAGTYTAEQDDQHAGQCEPHAREQKLRRGVIGRDAEEPVAGFDAGKGAPPQKTADKLTELKYTFRSFSENSKKECFAKSIP